MFDSINFIKNNVKKIDLGRLVDLDIPYFKFYIKQRLNKTTYIDWKCTTNDILLTEGYYFSYNSMNFMYLQFYECIIIRANAHQVLEKQDITLNDRDEYLFKVDTNIEKILGMKISQLELYRFDNYVDLNFAENEMKEYLSVLKKHRMSYRYMTQKKKYETSIHLSSKNGKTNINIYDKYQCELDKYKKKHKRKYADIIDMADSIFSTNVNIPELEIYKGKLRIEVQNKKALVNDVAVKIEKKENKTINEMWKQDKDIIGYWNEESMQEYYFDLLKNYLYTGTYYKLDIARQKVDNSSYSDNYKFKLKEFLFYVNRYGITDVIKSKDNKVRHKVWANSTVEKYIGMLTDININPITLDNDSMYDSLESLYTLAQRVAKEKYFKISNAEIEYKPRVQEKTETNKRVSRFKELNNFTNDFDNLEF